MHRSDTGCSKIHESIKELILGQNFCIVNNPLMILLYFVVQTILSFINDFVRVFTKLKNFPKYYEKNDSFFLERVIFSKN